MAGGFIADLHGRDLREEDLIRIWAPEDRLQLQLALESARRRPDPLVIEALAQTDSGAALQLEIMLTPLAGQNGEIDRMMGFYQPTSPVAALMGQTVGRLKLMSIRAAADNGVGVLPRLRLATVDGRQVA